MKLIKRIKCFFNHYFGEDFQHPVDGGKCHICGKHWSDIFNK